MSAVVNVDSPVFTRCDVLLCTTAVHVVKVDVANPWSKVGSTDTNSSCTCVCGVGGRWEGVEGGGERTNFKEHLERLLILH